MKALLTNAACMILIHNHVSGLSILSDEDIKVANRMEKIGKYVGVNLLDFIILGKDDYYSFTENNLIKNKSQ